MNRSLLWLLLSCLLAPFVWGVAWAVVGAPAALSGGASLIESLFFLPLALLGSAIWASIPVAVLAPIYALFLFAWPGLARRHPELEASRRGIAIGCVLLAAPAAFFVAWSRAQSGDHFSISSFLSWGGMAGLAGTVSLLVPRLFVPSLAPGAFR